MTRQELTEQKATLIAYLQNRLKAQDWHGVADAAMDLRETEAKLEVLKGMPEVPPDENWTRLPDQPSKRIS